MRFLILAIIAVIIVRHIVYTVRIESNSMYPSLPVI